MQKLQITNDYLLSIYSAMVVVVGKGELLSADDNWNALIEGCKKHGTYISTKKPIDE